MFPFQLLHCDVWTSPIISNSGFKFYLVVMDDFSHFTWTFPLRRKSDVLPTIISFHVFVATQFCCPIVSLQTEKGREFDNHASHSFLPSLGIRLYLTCPYTSQQNGRAERALRTLNESMHTMLFHASALLTFWPDTLATATYLLNRRPCRARSNATPHDLLLGRSPDYSHLHVFGYLCYPNIADTVPHKLAPRSTPCIFLSYPVDTKGYRCYNPTTKRVLTSHHVCFDETVFPFRSMDNAQVTCPPQPAAPDSILVPVVASRRHVPRDVNWAAGSPAGAAAAAPFYADSFTWTRHHAGYTAGHASSGILRTSRGLVCVNTNDGCSLDVYTDNFYFGNRWRCLCCYSPTSGATSHDHQGM